MSVSPLTRDLLDLTLPAIDDVDLETLIDQRTMALVRAIESTHQQRGRGQLVVQFFEKRRRKSYFFGKEEDVCWEQWTVDVTLATPRSETGMCFSSSCLYMCGRERGGGGEVKNTG
jgi:autophagy-related protein 101